MKITTAILDLDGVLVDFVTPAMKVWEVTLTGYRQYPDVGWDVVKACNLLREEEGLPEVSPSSFWDGFDFDFWAGLPWLAGAKEFLASIEDMFGVDNIVICTSDTLSSACTGGKAEWITTHLPQYNRRRFIGPLKSMLAAPSRVLVDDADHNCEGFLKAGGNAVLLPRPWNIKSYHISDPYKHALIALEMLCS